MNHVWQRRTLQLFVAALLFSGAGCKNLAKVREVHQDLAIDRRGQLVVMPLTSSVSLCNIKFDEGELEGSRDYFTQTVRENLNHSLSKEIKVMHPKALNQFLKRHGHTEQEHFDKRLSLKLARELDVEIVAFGHVKVDPVASGDSRRYDLDFELYLFEAATDERLATLRCAGKHKHVIHTIPWLVKQLKFYPPVTPPAKPVPKRPKEDKPESEKEEAKKEPAGKQEPKKEVPKKPDAKTQAPKQPAPKKPATKKADVKKDAPKQPAPKKPVVKKEAPKKTDVKKDAPKPPAPKKEDVKKEEPEKKEEKAPAAK